MVSTARIATDTARCRYIMADLIIMNILRNCPIGQGVLHLLNIVDMTVMYSFYSHVNVGVIKMALFIKTYSLPFVLSEVNGPTNLENKLC